MNIGIIGGADGPTSIFLSSSTKTWIIASVAVLALFVIIFLVGFMRRGQK